MYIFDSNAFITPHRTYYSFRFGTRFWDRLEQLATSGIIGTIDKVKKEIDQSTDQLSAWFNRVFRDPVTFRHKSSSSNLFIFGADEQNALHMVYQWAINSSYTKAAIMDFIATSNADPFLLAFCKTHSLTLVTEEKYNKDIKRRIPLPNACIDLDVKWLSLFDFMCQINFKL